MLELLHGRMFLVAAGRFPGSYNDNALKALVAVAEKHEIKLVLCKPNYGCTMFTNLLISSVQQHPNELRVEDANWGTVAKDQRIVDVVEPVMNERRLIVRPSVIEQDFNGAKHVNGKRGALYCLIYKMTRTVCA
jgi:hypothetical protein